MRSQLKQTFVHKKLFFHGCLSVTGFKKVSDNNFFAFNTLMHQSIPAAPIPPPPGNCGAFACIVSPGGRALAYPRVTPGLLTHTWFLTRNPHEDDFIGKDQ